MYFVQQAQPIRLMNAIHVLFVGEDAGAYLTNRLAALHLAPLCRFVHLADDSQLWHYLDGQPQLPHLLILDLDLPTYAGLDKLQILKAHPPYRLIHIVVYTSVADPDWEVLCRQAGADQVLLKQAGAATLLTDIQSVTRYPLLAA